MHSPRERRPRFGELIQIDGSPHDAGKVYCVRTNGPGTALRGARVTLLHFQDGGMRIDYKNRSLPYTHVKTRPGPDPAEDEKSLDARMAGIVAATTATPPS